MARRLQAQLNDEERAAEFPVTAGRPEGAARAVSPPFRSTPMTLPETISADYTLRPSELAEVLALLVEARQPTMVWGPPGAAKSMIRLALTS